MVQYETQIEDIDGVRYKVTVKRGFIIKRAEVKAKGSRIGGYSNLVKNRTVTMPVEKLVRKSLNQAVCIWQDKKSKEKELSEAIECASNTVKEIHERGNNE